MNTNEMLILSKQNGDEIGFQECLVEIFASLSSKSCYHCGTINNTTIFKTYIREFPTLGNYLG